MTKTILVKNNIFKEFFGFFFVLIGLVIIVSFYQENIVKTKYCGEIFKVSGKNFDKKTYLVMSVDSLQKNIIFKVSVEEFNSVNDGDIKCYDLTNNDLNKIIK